MSKKVNAQVSNGIYYSVVFGLFSLQTLIASFVDDLTLVIGIISAFAEATVSFVFPGLFFFISAWKFRKAKTPYW